MPKESKLAKEEVRTLKVIDNEGESGRVVLFWWSQLIAGFGVPKWIYLIHGGWGSEKLEVDFGEGAGLGDDKIKSMIMGIRAYSLLIFVGNTGSLNPVSLLVYENLEEMYKDDKLGNSFINHR